MINNDRLDRHEEYILKLFELQAEYKDIFPDEDNQWVEVEYANHAIRPWAVEEVCFFCGGHATHKIEETTGPRNFHPLTAYVCCKHFFGGCEVYPYQDMG